MDYIFLKETAFENLYRLYAWDVFKYLTVHEEAFENEKINYVYNELLSYFVKRDRVNFPYSNEYKIKNIRIPKEDYFFSGGFAGGLGRKIGRAGLSFCASLAAMQAKKAGLAYPQSFFGMLAGGNLNETLVGNIITALPEGVSEIMTHPGLNKQELDKHFSWNYHWEDELQAFLSDKNKNLLEQHKVALINFGGLR
jgi:hypothetical protein